MATLPPLDVSQDDRIELERRTRYQTIEHRAAQRAKIVLLAADGWTNRAIADKLDLGEHTVGRWRSRYQAEGIDGLADRPRSGRPPIYGHDDHVAIVKQVCEHTPPGNLSYWTLPGLVNALEDSVGISQTRLWEILDEKDLETVAV